MRLKEQAILLKNLSTRIQKHLQTLLEEGGLVRKALKDNKQALEKLAARDVSDLNEAIPEQALLNDLITHCRMCDGILEICSLKGLLLNIGEPKFTKNHIGDILFTETAILRFLDKPYHELASDDSADLIEIVEFTRTAAISWLCPIRMFVFFPDDSLQNLFAEKTPKKDIIQTFIQELQNADQFAFSSDVLEKYTENELKFLNICKDFHDDPLSVEIFIAKLASLRQTENIQKFVRFVKGIYSRHFSALHVCNPNNGSLHQLMLMLSYHLLEDTDLEQQHTKLLETFSNNGTLLKNPADLKNQKGNEMLNKFFRLKLNVLILKHSEELNPSSPHSEHSPTDGTSPSTLHSFL